MDHHHNQVSNNKMKTAMTIYIKIVLTKINEKFKEFIIIC